MTFGKSEITTAWKDDVQKASQIAYDMVRRYAIPTINESNIEDFEFKIGEKNELSDKSNTIIDRKVEAILKVIFIPKKFL